MHDWVRTGISSFETEKKARVLDTGPVAVLVKIALVKPTPRGKGGWCAGVKKQQQRYRACSVTSALSS